MIAKMERGLRWLIVGLPIALCVAARVPAYAQAPHAASRRDSQTVVFVCEHGSVKSVLALAYFQQLAREKHLPYRAISRGTAPDSALPVFMLEGLRRDGFDLAAFTPTRFSERDLLSAVRVISFDQPTVTSVVDGRVPTSAWDNLPAASANYAVARDSIRHRVAILVDSLARASQARRKRSAPKRD